MWKLLKYIGIYPPDRVFVTREDCDMFLYNAFIKHGLPCGFHNGWIVAQNGLLKAITNLVPLRDDAEYQVVQLDLRVETYDGYRILESFVGSGRSRELAVSDALSSMMESSFHVIFNALSGTTCDCDVWKWKFANGDRGVYLGNFIVTSNLQTPEIVSQIRQFHEQILNYVKELSLSNDLHWVRIFQSLSPNGRNISEILVDNKPVAHLEKLMSELPWPKPEYYCSTRVFLIVEGQVDQSTHQ